MSTKADSDYVENAPLVAKLKAESASHYRAAAWWADLGCYEPRFFHAHLAWDLGFRAAVEEGMTNARTH